MIKARRSAENDNGQENKLFLNFIFTGSEKDKEKAGPKQKQI